MFSLFIPFCAKQEEKLLIQGREQYVGVAATSSTAERIADEILSSNEEILSVSVIDWSGNILAVKSRESFTERIRVSW